MNAELARLRTSRQAEGHYSLRDSTVPLSGFFQANHDLQGDVEGADCRRRSPMQGETLFEGYCGGGFFTEGVAGRFKRVVAADNDLRTLRDAGTGWGSPMLSGAMRMPRVLYLRNYGR